MHAECTPRRRVALRVTVVEVAASIEGDEVARGQARPTAATRRHGLGDVRGEGCRTKTGDREYREGLRKEQRSPRKASSAERRRPLSPRAAKGKMGGCSAR